MNESLRVPASASAGSRKMYPRTYCIRQEQRKGLGEFNEGSANGSFQAGVKI